MRSSSERSVVFTQHPHTSLSVIKAILSYPSRVYVNSKTTNSKVIYFYMNPNQLKRMNNIAVRTEKEKLKTRSKNKEAFRSPFYYVILIPEIVILCSCADITVSANIIQKSSLMLCFLGLPVYLIPLIRHIQTVLPKAEITKSKFLKEMPLVNVILPDSENAFCICFHKISAVAFLPLPIPLSFY